MQTTLYEAKWHLFTEQSLRTWVMGSDPFNNNEIWTLSVISLYILFNK